MTSFGGLRTLAKDSFVYGIAGVLLRSMSALLVPVFSRAFSPSEYGALSIVLSTIALLSVLVVLALDNSSARWFYDSESEADRKSTFATWVWTYLVAATVAGLLLLLVSRPMAAVLLENSSDWHLFALAAVTLPAAVLGQVLFTWLRVQRRSWAAVGYATWTSFLTIGATLILILGMDQGLPGVFVAQIIAGVGGTLAAVLMMRDWLSPRRFAWGRLRAMLRYGLPLIPAALGFWIINISDRYLLNFLASRDEVGLYQVSYSVAAITFLATSAFQQAWGPFAFSIHTQPQARAVYAKTLTAYGWLASLVAAGTALLAPEILRVVAPGTYSGSAMAVPALVFGYVFLGAYYIAAIGPAIVKTTKPVASAIGLAAGINLALNVILIPSLEIVGAAMATLVAYGAMAFYLFVRSQRLYPIPYRFAPVLAFGASAFAASWVLSRWEFGNLWFGIAIKLGIVAALVPAAFVFRLISVREAKQLLRQGAM